LAEGATAGQSSRLPAAEYKPEQPTMRSIFALNHFRAILSSVVLLALLGRCSAVTIKHHAVGYQPPLCSHYQADDKIAVL